MSVIMPVGPGWGRVQTQGAETFTVPDLPVGGVFYGFQPTYCAGSKLEIYSNGTLIKTRLFDANSPNETSAVVGRIPHGGGDLTFVCTPSTQLPYNVYALGWGHIGLDEDPSHWTPYTTPTWIINTYTDQSSFTGDYASVESTYGPGTPTSVQGVGPHFEQDPQLEAGMYASLVDGGERNPSPGNLGLSTSYGSHPATAASSHGNGFALSRIYRAAMTQEAFKIPAVDITTLPFQFATNQEGQIDMSSSVPLGAWGGMSYGSPQYKPVRFNFSSVSANAAAMGTCKVYALQGGTRVSYPGSGRIPLNTWTSNQAGWQQPEGRLALLFSQAFDQSEGGVAPSHVHEFDQYMIHAIAEPAQPTGYVARFLRFVVVSSQLQTGVLAINTPSDGTKVGVTAYIGAGLALEHKSPPSRRYGFPLLTGVLKCKIEDLVEWPAYGPWWTQVGTGRGYAAMKVATMSTWDLEHSPRWGTTPTHPLYVMTTDGWRSTAHLQPPPPESPPP